MNAQPDGELTSPTQNSHEWVDAETADRVFRTKTEYGIVVTGEFKAKKQILSGIHDSVRAICEENLEASHFFAPSPERIHRSYLKYRAGGNPSRLTGIEFFNLLVLLAEQERPFVQPVSELKIAADGELQFQFGFVAAVKSRPELPAEACRAAVLRSQEALRAWTHRDALYPVWDSISPGGRIDPERIRREFRKGRVDFMLRGMFPAYRGAENSDGRLKGLIRRHVFLPLLNLLRDRNLVVSMSCADLRRSDPANLASVSDVLWLNNAERINERYARLADLSRSELFTAFLAADHVQPARDMGGDREAFEENRAVMAGNILRVHAGNTGLTRLHRDILIELIKLREWREINRRKEELQRELRDIEKDVEKIKKHKGMFNAIRNGGYLIAEKTLRMILEGRLERVLGAVYPASPPDTPLLLGEPPMHDGIYVLYRDREYSAAAVNDAIQHFRRTGDDFLPRILERVLKLDKVGSRDLKQYIAPIHQDLLTAELRIVYRSYLPWYTRLRLYLFRRELDAEQIHAVKGKLAVREYLRLSKTTSARTRSIQKQRPPESPEQYSRDNRAEQIQISGAVLRKLTKAIEEAWERRNLPHRVELLRLLPSADSVQTALILGAVEAGHPDVHDIVRIPVAGTEPVYGSRAYMKAHSREILDYCDELRGRESVALAEGIQGIMRWIN